MRFGEKVKAARIENGYSQQKLADKTGIALRTIQNYENKGMLPKQREYYTRLSEALHIEQSVLLDDDAEFVLMASEQHGRKGREQAERLITEVRGLYAGGELEEEDMDAMMRALQEAYWIAKEKNRRFIPKKYRQDDNG